MSTETPTPELNWPVLSIIERRILGVLVEKAKTTPEQYPLSLNAVMTGCNQKSNRDPLMNLDEVETEQGLERLKGKGLVIKVTGSRVDRWRQSLYEVWAVSKKELAILAELLLRGPQTLGELRTRVSRMEPIETQEELRDLLKPLLDRKLVLYLTTEKARGAMVTHGFHVPEELERIKTIFPSGGSSDELSPTPTPVSRTMIDSESQLKIQNLEATILQLQTDQRNTQTEIQSMKSEIQTLRKSLTDLQTALGVEVK